MGLPVERPNWAIQLDHNKSVSQSLEMVLAIVKRLEERVGQLEKRCGGAPIVGDLESFHKDTVADINDHREMIDRLADLVVLVEDRTDKLPYARLRRLQDLADEQAAKPPIGRPVDDVEALMEIGRLVQEKRGK